MSEPTATTNDQSENTAGGEARAPDEVLTMVSLSPFAHYPAGSIELKRHGVTLCIVPQPPRAHTAAMARQAQRDNAKLFAAAPLVMEALIDLLAVCMEGAPPQDLTREMRIRRCDAITRATSAIRVAINGPDRPANQQDQSTAHVEATLGVTGSRPPDAGLDEMTQRVLHQQKESEHTPRAKHVGYTETGALCDLREMVREVRLRCLREIGAVPEPVLDVWNLVRRHLGEVTDSPLSPPEKVNVGSANTNPNPAPAGPPPVSRTAAKMPVFHAGCDGATPTEPGTVPREIADKIIDACSAPASSAEAAPPQSNAVEIPPPMRCAICLNPGTNFQVPMDGSHAGKWLCDGCCRSHAANCRCARGRVIEVPPKSEVAAFTSPGRAPVDREPAATPAPPPKHEPVLAEGFPNGRYFPHTPFVKCGCCGNHFFLGHQIDVKA